MSFANYTEERNITFRAVADKLRSNIEFESENALIIHGDSLEALKKIPSHSISLILTDPPYHSTKKKNIKNDTSFETDNEFLSWIEEFSIEWHRVLKPNGSLYVYCSSTMAARIEVLLMKQFNILSHVVWTKPNEPGFDGWKQKMKKESLRQWYDHSERIIFAEPAYEGNLFRTWLGNFLKQQRVKCGLSGHLLTEMTGAYAKVNHGGAVSNWEAGRNIPSREQYQKICNAFLSTGKVHEMPPYEDVVRPFETNSTCDFTDIWTFNSVRPYNGKHPAEKPIDMLEHCVVSSSYEQDIILDCFAGSGNTTLAALKNNRKTIAIEIEDKWIISLKEKLNRLSSIDKLQIGFKKEKKKNTSKVSNQPYLIPI